MSVPARRTPIWGRNTDGWPRRGKSRAAVAVGHTILVIVYHVLRDGPVSHDLGPHDFDERDRRAVERRLVHRLEGLGSTVFLEPTAQRLAGIA